MLSIFDSQNSTAPLNRTRQQLNPRRSPSLPLPKGEGRGEGKVSHPQPDASAFPKQRLKLTWLLLLSLLSINFTILDDDSSKSNSEKLVPLKIELPTPVFAGTPKEAPAGVDVEPTPKEPP